LTEFTRRKTTQLDSLSDHALMLKVKQGDLEKLGLLYHRFSRRMFGFFFRLTGDGMTSEDLVQNVFMRMLKYRHTYSDTGRFETWAFKLARNVHHDHYRKNGRYSYQANMTDWEHKLKDEKNVETIQAGKDELDILTRALSALDSEKRELIELTRFQKMKYVEVGKMLGISETAVKVRIHRIMKELRKNYVRLDA